MRTFLALVLLGFCVFRSHSAAAENSGCVLTRVMSLPLTVTRGHALTVPVSLDGHDVSLQVDTGSYASLLIEPEAKLMGLTVHHYFGAYSYGLAGATNLGTALVHNLKLGPLHADALDMGVVSLNREHRPGDPVGLLGIDFLHHYDLDFDVANQTLSFFLRDHCPQKVVYWKPEVTLQLPFTTDPQGRIETTVQMNQAVFPCLLDTGASTSLIDLEKAKELALDPAAAGVTVINKMGAIGDDPIKAYSYRLSNMVLGDETLRNFKIAIADESNIGIHMRRADRVLLGADFILQNHVYISFEDRIIFFSPYKYRLAPPAEMAPETAAAP